MKHFASALLAGTALGMAGPALASDPGQEALEDGELEAVRRLVVVDLTEEEDVRPRQLVEEGLEGDVFPGLARADGDRALDGRSLVRRSLLRCMGAGVEDVGSRRAAGR